MNKWVPTLAAMMIMGGAAAAHGEQAKPAEQHRARALELAGRDYDAWARRICRLPEKTKTPVTRLPATRIFDNLVFLGWDSNMGNAWALLTSDGIILFDTLGSAEEAETFIVGGLRSLGLDPLSIKRIVVMHGHNDHSGGAAYLRSLTGAPIYMSDPDWNLVGAPAAHGSPHGNSAGQALTRGETLGDGDVLTLGTTSIRFFLTPGHTAGTLSALIPVSDGGQRHVAAYWGGTSIPASAPDARVYIHSVDRYSPIARHAGADLLISNHPTNDLTLARLPALAARKAGEAHPFVIGRDGVGRMFQILRECALAARDMATVAP